MFGLEKNGPDSQNDKIIAVLIIAHCYTFSFFMHALAQCKQSLLVHLPSAYSLPFEVFEFMNNRKRLRGEREGVIYIHIGDKYI